MEYAYVRAAVCACVCLLHCITDDMNEFKHHKKFNFHVFLQMKQ